MTYIPTPSDSMHPNGHTATGEPFYRRYLVVIATLLAGSVFLLAPWSFEQKAHAFMHGLCAQTPDHSFYFAGRVLPFDGRMTGIYSGLLVTVAVLVWRGRYRSAARPGNGAGLLLLLFFGAMAIDGFNSLLFDLGRWHPYMPSNELRLITGWMAGVGIGVVMIMLVGMTFWHHPKMTESVVPHWWWPLGMLLPIIPVRALMATGSLLVYYPFSIFLMMSAVIAFTTLVLVVLVMLRNRENQFTSFGQLSAMTTASMLFAIVIILAIGGGRFWLESVMHIPAMT